MDVNFVHAFFAMVLKIWLIGTPNRKQKLSENSADVFTQTSKPNPVAYIAKNQRLGHSSQCFRISFFFFLWLICDMDVQKCMFAQKLSNVMLQQLNLWRRGENGFSAFSAFMDSVPIKKQ